MNWNTFFTLFLASRTNFSKTEPSRKFSIFKVLVFKTDLFEFCSASIFAAVFAGARTMFFVCSSRFKPYSVPFLKLFY